MSNAYARLGIVVLLLLIVGCDSASAPLPEETTGTNRPASQHSTSEARTDLPPGSSTEPAAPLDGEASVTPTEVKSLDELLLFFPSKYPVGDWMPLDFAYQDVWLEASDGTRLHGWLCAHPQPQAVVLFLHGNAGSPTVEGVLADARAARRFLAEASDDSEEEVVLVGRSLGGAIAVQLASEKAPRGLVLESTFSSLKDAADIHYPRLSWLVPAEKLNSQRQIARYSGPLLQSHGDADRTIPISLARRLHAAAPGPKSFIVINGGDHNDGPSAAYREEFAAFINRLP